MDNEIISEKSLEQVSGGWDPGAPDSVKYCPCCGADTTAGIGTGNNPRRGLIICCNQKCALHFEVYMEGEMSGQHTGNYYDPYGKKVDVQQYREELTAKGLL